MINGVRLSKFKFQIFSAVRRYGDLPTGVTCKELLETLGPALRACRLEIMLLWSS